MNGQKWISRGQRKRLASKSKFVNMRLMEKKHREEEEAIMKLRREEEAKIREERKAKNASAAGGDMEMDGDSNFVDHHQKKKKVLSDFGAMGDMLNKIENKMHKQIRLSLDAS